MAQRHIVFRPAPQPGDVAQQLAERFEAIRREFEVPEGFPPAVVAEAAHAAGLAQLPDRDEKKNLPQTMNVDWIKTWQNPTYLPPTPTPTPAP